MFNFIAWALLVFSVLVIFISPFLGEDKFNPVTHTINIVLWGMVAALCGHVLGWW